MASRTPFALALAWGVLLLTSACRRPDPADPANAGDRSCAKDEDCVLVQRACCPCGNGDSADAVNRRSEGRYLYHCTEAEIHTCAEQGACARVAEPVPICRAQLCAVEARPIVR